MVYYSALHWAKKAEASAKLAADLAQTEGKVIQLGFDGFMQDGQLVFKHAPGGVDVPYQLVDDVEYELDLAYNGDLDSLTTMVVKNGGDTISFVSALHRSSTEPATVADMDAVMRFNSSTGYRWLFKAAYKVTPSGAKVFLLYPVVAKEDTTKITNCITEIPQDIKLELNNGTLTLKAGSKVYVPNGSGVFEEKITTKDLQYKGYYSDTRMLVVKSDLSGLDGLTTSAMISGTTAPTSTQYMFWYDTTNNIIKLSIDKGVTWTGQYSLPICIETSSSSAITSIDQVFNGFGFIGSTVFALPGVKGLIPDGRNADGSLKNIETTVNKVAVLTFGSNVYTPHNGRFLLNSSGGIFARVGGYDPVRNYITASDNKTPLSGCSFAEGCLVEAGVIKTFNSKLPFRAVDYNDFQQLASNIFSAGNIGDIKYTSRTDVPNGGAWCDGALYTKAQFPDIYQMLVDGKLQSITVSAFDSSVSANGSCGFFGLDTANKRFKVPLLKDVYIKAGQAGEMFGAESLPNIKGLLTLAGTLPVASANETSSATGAFYGDGKDTAQKHDASTFIGGAGKFGFNASRSSSTYKDNTKVNPDHVTYRAYIVLYSSTTEASVTQAAEFMTALGGKVNVNLDNVASNIDYVVSSGKVSNGGWVIWKSGRIEQWGRVDYPTGVASGTNYTITLPKPYTSNYSLATDYVLEPSGWGKYSTVSRSLTNFAFRLDSSSGNLQASLRSFSWYTTGF